MEEERDLRAKLNVGLTVLCMSCFPVLMLAFPTDGMITKLWSAALMVLSVRIGSDIAPSISTNAAIRWLVIDVAVFLVLVLWGVLNVSTGTLGHRLGSLAVMQVGIFLPIGVLLAGLFDDRRTSGPIDTSTE